MSLALLPFCCIFQPLCFSLPLCLSHCFSVLPALETQMSTLNVTLNLHFNLSRMSKQGWHLRSPMTTFVWTSLWKVSGARTKRQFSMSGFLTHSPVQNLVPHELLCIAAMTAQSSALTSSVCSKWSMDRLHFLCCLRGNRRTIGIRHMQPFKQPFAFVAFAVNGVIFKSVCPLGK